MLRAASANQRGRAEASHCSVLQKVASVKNTTDDSSMKLCPKMIDAGDKASTRAAAHAARGECQRRTNKKSSPTPAALKAIETARPHTSSEPPQTTQPAPAR